MVRIGKWGRLPTVGETKVEGMTGIYVYCSSCMHSCEFGFDDVMVDDDLAFVDVAAVRRFVCSQRASRQVTLMANWHEIPYKPTPFIDYAELATKNRQGRDAGQQTFRQGVT